jgi:hypothetical protein
MAKKSNSSGKKIVMMLGQLIVLAVCFYNINYVYQTSIRPDLAARQNFRETECFIMSKKLSTKGKYFRGYRADFLINYHANGVQYNRWVSGNGLDMSYTSNNASQEQMLSDYEDGVNYSCWYNPENAEIAVLVLRQNWFTNTSLIISLIVSVMMILLLIKNSLQLLFRMKETRRKIRQMKTQNDFKY